MHLLVVVVRLQHLGVTGQVLERMAAVIKSEGQVLCKPDNMHISFQMPAAQETTVNMTLSLLNTAPWQLRKAVR